MASSHPIADLNTLFLNKALTNHVRNELREFFKEQAKPIIEDMVEEAIKDLQTDIEVYRNQLAFENIVRVMLVDKRTK